jgi:hypothetical protein
MIDDDNDQKQAPPQPCYLSTLQSVFAQGKSFGVFANQWKDRI